MPVHGGFDYLKKVYSFAQQRFGVHCHVNGRYFRGLLLALAALVIMRGSGNRCVLTFHAGTVQTFFSGWRKVLTWPFYKLAFALSHAVICNSGAEQRVLAMYGFPGKVLPIQAFSRQYLDFDRRLADDEMQSFVDAHEPLIVSYTCFRDGFFWREMFDGVQQVMQRNTRMGLVIVGTDEGTDEARRCVGDLGISDDVLLAGNVEHDVFMTLLESADVYLRSYVSDGVSASVLESLAIGTPVVASENGTRPPSVATYAADDPDSLAQQLMWVIGNRPEVTAKIEAPETVDTVDLEVDLLLGQSSA